MHTREPSAAQGLHGGHGLARVGQAIDARPARPPLWCCSGAGLRRFGADRALAPARRGTGTAGHAGRGRAVVGGLLVALLRFPDTCFTLFLRITSVRRRFVNSQDEERSLFPWALCGPWIVCQVACPAQIGMLRISDVSHSVNRPDAHLHTLYTSPRLRPDRSSEI